MFPMTVTIHNQQQLQALLAAMTTAALPALGAAPLPAIEPAQATATTATTATKEVAAAPVEKFKNPKKEAAATATPATSQPTAEVEAAAAPAPKDTNTQSSATPESAGADSAQDDGQAEAPTYQDAAAAITKLSRVKGRDAAVALLAEFKAAKLPDVKPEQFAAIIAKATALAGE